MNTKLLLAVAMAALAVPLSIAPAAAQSASMAHAGPARGNGSYQDLLGVWAEFRTWRGGWQARTPDWSAAGMAAERAAMATYLARVENMNVAAMDRGQRAEWLAARAKMLEHHFLLDVAKPWERDPGFYVDKMLDIGFAELPATGEALAKLKTRLADVPTLTATARAANKDRFFTYITSIAEENAFFSSGQTAAFGIRLEYDSTARRTYILDVFETGPAFAAGFDRGAEILGTPDFVFDI